jgi:hypothetical protein
LIYFERVIPSNFVSYLLSFEAIKIIGIGLSASEFKHPDTNYRIDAIRYFISNPLNNEQKAR